MLLTGSARTSALATLPLWNASLSGRDTLSRRIKFVDFSHAWAFMNRVALAAEKADHHPEWFNIYGTIDITLSTHDAGGLGGLGGVTLKDIDLALKIDRYAKEGGALQ
jgi:4a-hydroxytetrahydrobiopterin dehydratase